ncbi:MAG: response regulator [Polyangia bacterium]
MSTSSTSPALDFRLIVESGPWIVLVLDPELTVVAISDAGVQLTRRSRAQVIGRPVLELLREPLPDGRPEPKSDSVASLGASLARVLQTRTADVTDLRQPDFRSPNDGGREERCLRWYNTPVLGPGGEVAYIIQRADDVTESVRRAGPAGEPRVGSAGLRPHAEADEQRERREPAPVQTEPSAPPASANEPATEPLILVVEDNAEVNRFICAVLASRYRTASASDGREGLELSRTLQPDLILTDLRMPQLSGLELIQALRASGDLIPVLVLTGHADDQMHASLLRAGAQDYLTKPFSPDELRARVGNLVTLKRARDVLQSELASRSDDVSALAAEISQRKRELKATLAAMQVALAQAERAAVARSVFLNMVSHELRTPLNGLQLQLRLLKGGRGQPLTEKQQETVGQIAGTVGRLKELVDAVVEYTRIQSGRLELHIEPFDLPALCRQTTEEMQAQVQHKGLALRTELPSELPPLQSDRRLVQIILVHLVTNAIKFTERGSVVVAAEGDTQEQRLSVTDTGPGIPKEQQQLVFEPFEQLTPIRQKHVPGMGLGLAVAKELVSALGGRIELRSEPGAGSTFRVIIPTGAAQ